MKLGPGQSVARVPTLDSEGQRVLSRWGRVREAGDARPSAPTRRTGPIARRLPGRAVGLEIDRNPERSSVEPGKVRYGDRGFCLGRDLAIGEEMYSASPVWYVAAGRPPPALGSVRLPVERR